MAHEAVVNYRKWATTKPPTHPTLQYRLARRVKNAAKMDESFFIIIYSNIRISS